jgi:aspartate kinase
VTTTLGREGSDYTAALVANLLQAESLTVWKDVGGVMNADPKLFPHCARVIPVLDYTDVVEMAHCGAQVLHPKTIKPLQNGNIPLHVKSFLEPTMPGTLIHSASSEVNNNHSNHPLPPIIVFKRGLVLMHIRSTDLVGWFHISFKIIYICDKLIIIWINLIIY